MTDVGNAFNWAFRDPHWLSKFLIIALIGLIPIVGQINTFGWMLHANVYESSNLGTIFGEP